MGLPPHPQTSGVDPLARAVRGTSHPPSLRRQTGHPGLPSPAPRFPGPTRCQTPKSRTGKSTLPSPCRRTPGLQHPCRLRKRLIPRRRPRLRTRPAAYTPRWPLRARQQLPRQLLSRRTWKRGRHRWRTGKRVNLRCLRVRLSLQKTEARRTGRHSGARDDRVASGVPTTQISGTRRGPQSVWKAPRLLGSPIMVSPGSQTGLSTGWRMATLLATHHCAL
jgi:hypothetical protein